MTRGGGPGADPGQALDDVIPPPILPLVQVGPDLCQTIEHPLEQRLALVDVQPLLGRTPDDQGPVGDRLPMVAEADRAPDPAIRHEGGTSRRPPTRPIRQRTGRPLAMMASVCFSPGGTGPK